jgi:hypothetical protein
MSDRTSSPQFTVVKACRRPQSTATSSTAGVRNPIPSSAAWPRNTTTPSLSQPPAVSIIGTTTRSPQPTAQTRTGPCLLPSAANNADSDAQFCTKRQPGTRSVPMPSASPKAAIRAQRCTKRVARAHAQTEPRDADSGAQFCTKRRLGTRSVRMPLASPKAAIRAQSCTKRVARAHCPNRTPVHSFAQSDPAAPIPSRPKQPLLGSSKKFKHTAVDHPDD